MGRQRRKIEKGGGEEIFGLKGHAKKVSLQCQSSHQEKKGKEREEGEEKVGKNFSVGLDRKRNCSKDKEVEEEVA